MNRRNFLQIGTSAVAVTLYAPAMLLTGCPMSSSSISTLIGTLGKGCSQLATVLGNTALAAQITTLTAAAVAAVTGWKSGSPTAEAIEAINALEAVISMISSLNPAVALLVTLALGTIDSILSMLPPDVVVGRVQAAMQARPRIKINNPPKTVAVFKDYWKDIIAASTDSSLNGAIIK